jgi:transposase InsO family protein
VGEPQAGGADLFIRAPEHIRSDNGSEFTARRVREWLGRVGAKTLYIEPGSPWENGYIESFNGKLQDEPWAREVLGTLLEAKVLIERWRKAYNTVRPHSSLGYRLRLRSRAAPTTVPPRLDIGRCVGRHACPGHGRWNHYGSLLRYFASFAMTSRGSKRSCGVRAK